MSDNVASETLSSELYDLVVVGSGVVGCALARRFTLEGARVLILEKADDFLEGASKANSAILHTGFDAPGRGSQELECLRDGYEEYRQIRSRLNLPLVECGAMVLAWDQHEAEQLERLLQQAQGNGIDDARLITKQQVASREAKIAGGVAAALEVPGESIIDPWSAPYAYLLQAIDNGAEFMRRCELLGGSFEAGEWMLETAAGTLRCRNLVVSAGLYGDHLNRLLVGDSKFEIRPRKGQFVVFDKSAAGLTQSILLPVPSETTKGIVVCPTVFGNLLVGPTAEEQQDRSQADVASLRLQALIDRGREILPGLAGHEVTASYAGLRPATQHKDYQIEWQAQYNYCSVGGIRSTGLSAALGIARYVYRLYREAGNAHAPLPQPSWPRICSIAESRGRDWQRAGNDGIVCHCELVTRREIKSALQGPLAAASLSALKRRTRVGMGRCQGFYCSAELSELTDGCFQQALGLKFK